MLIYGIYRRPILEDWLKEVKDPINKATEVLNEASEVFKRLPDLPNNYGQSK